MTSLASRIKAPILQRQMLRDLGVCSKVWAQGPPRTEPGNLAPYWGLRISQQRKPAKDQDLCSASHICCLLFPLSSIVRAAHDQLDLQREPERSLWLSRCRALVSRGGRVHSKLVWLPHLHHTSLQAPQQPGLPSPQLQTFRTHRTREYGHFLWLSCRLFFKNTSFMETCFPWIPWGCSTSQPPFYKWGARHPE